MNDRLSELAQARKHLHVPWSEGRARRVWSGVQRRRRRRQVLRTAAVVGLVLVLALLGGDRRPAPLPVREVPLARLPAPPAPPPGKDEEIRPQAQRGGVVAGSGVDPGEDRVQEVEERREEPRPPAPQRQARPRPAPEPPAARPRSSWRDLAQEGQFERAYGALHEAGAEVTEDPEDLLLRADVARLSHHPAEALGPLTRFLARYADDPRAPLAAFTLGRVLLDDLGRPRDAAAAFRRAQELAPAGEMAQDALAREVEAWSRAGDEGAARERATAYLARYPQGRRLRSVRRFGGLE
jgi:transmembrane sensor